MLSRTPLIDEVDGFFRTRETPKRAFRRMETKAAARCGAYIVACISSNPSQLLKPEDRRNSQVRTHFSVNKNANFQLPNLYLQKMIVVSFSEIGRPASNNLKIFISTQTYNIGEAFIIVRSWGYNGHIQTSVQIFYTKKGSTRSYYNMHLIFSNEIPSSSTN